MKKVELKQIKIQNFKGIANGTFNFDGNTDITADVMQGKSTIRDAYLFVMGIEIDNFYPVDINNQLIDGLETNVTVTLSVDDVEYEMSRSAKVKYKVNRDTNEKLFDGFKKDMFEFDKVPCTSTEYKNKLTQLLGVESFDTFKYLTILNYFNECVNWKERRELIYNLYVDKKAIDNLKDDIKYDLIANELKKGKTSADISTMLNSENLKLVDSKRKNDIILADSQQELATFEDIDYSKIEKEIGKVESAIEKESARVSKMSIDNIKLELEGKLSELERERLNISREDNHTYNTLNYNVTVSETNVANMKRKGISLENEIAQKVANFKAMSEEKFDTSLEKCPTCHQMLPNAKIEELRASWENDTKARLNALKNEIRALKGQLESYKEDLNNKMATAESYKEQLDNFIPNPRIAEIEKEKEEIQKQLDSKEEVVIDTSKLDALKDKKNALIVELGKKSQYEKLQNKIASLIEEQKDLVDTEIVLAKKRHQLEQYTLDIIDLVNDSINSHFKGIKFKLFETLTATAKKDIKETLVVLNNGVDYGACSTGQKAETNMIIVSTLQKTLKTNLPIWVDDASITNFNKLPSNQMIFLYNEKGTNLACTKIRDVY